MGDMKDMKDATSAGIAGPDGTNAGLEALLREAFEGLGIKEEHQKSIRDYLEILRKRDEATYHHSIRVGLLARDIARHYGLEEKALLWAGLLHDIGKAAVDGDVLRKRNAFSEKDYEEVRKHPVIAHDLLKGIHEHTAQVIIRHHRFQERSYPQVIPEPKVNYPAEVREKIERYARLLSIADFYDAVISRDNEKFDGRIKAEDVDRIKDVFRKHKPDDFAIIWELIDKGVLNGRYISLVRS